MGNRGKHSEQLLSLDTGCTSLERSSEEFSQQERKEGSLQRHCALTFQIKLLALQLSPLLCGITAVSKTP